MLSASNCGVALLLWANRRYSPRLLDEQCDIAPSASGWTPTGGAAAPVTPKAPKDVGSGSLQSPHDPEATYGHKGKGYEAQGSVQRACRAAGWP